MNVVGGTRDVQVLDWCPGQVVVGMEFSLLIFYDQGQGILSVWDLLECNFCMLLEMSGKDLN